MGRWAWGLGLVLVACGGGEVEEDGSVPTDNTAPVAVDDAIVVRTDSELTFDPTVNDQDPDLDPIEVVEVSPPAQGVAEVVDGSTVRYRPLAGYSGPDAFRYTIADGQGGTAEAEVSVEVMPAPALTIVAPEANADVLAGEVEVVVEVAGCELGGEAPMGCRITGGLDDEPIDPVTSTSFTVETETNGEQVLSLRLVGADGAPFEPAVGAEVRWFTVGGIDVGRFEGDATFADAASMLQFCADGFTNVAGNVFVTTTSAADTSGLACLERVDGGLFVEDTLLSSVSLPALDRVGGTIAFRRNDALTEIDLPDLDRVGSFVVNGNNLLTAFELPVLERTDERFGLYYHELLETVGVPRLTNVDGDLVLIGMPALKPLDFPALERVGGLVDMGSSFPFEVSFPSLVEVGGFDGFYAPTGISLPELTTVTESFSFYGAAMGDLVLPKLETVGQRFQIQQDDGTTSVSAPALVSIGDDLVLYETSVLTSIDLPVLTSTSDVNLRYNDALQGLALDVTTLDSIRLELNGSFGSLELPLLQQLGEGFLRGTGPTLDLRSLTTVTGDFWVRFSGVVTPELAALETVGGQFNLDGASILDPNLGNLRSVGRLDVGSDALQTLSLPSLTTVGEFLFVRCPVLQSLDLPVLQDVGETVSIQAGSLTSVSLPALISGGISAGGGGLTSVSVPLLAEGTVRVSGSALTTIDAPLLARGLLSVEDSGLTALVFDGIDDMQVSVRNNPVLESLTLSGDTINALDIAYNPVLADVTLDVTTLGGTSLFENDELTNIDAPTVVNLVGDVFVSGQPLLARVDFSGLTNAAGEDIRIRQSNGLADVRLGSLQTVGVLQLELPSLTTLDLGQLAQASVVDLDTPNLASVDLSGLVSTFSLRVEDTAVTALDLANLASVDELVVTFNPDLALLNTPALVSAVDLFQVEQNPLVPSVSAPLLTDLGRLEVNGNPSVTEVVMPLATSAILVRIASNGSLTTIDLSSLATTGPTQPGFLLDGDLRVRSNLVLDDLRMGSLVDVAGDLFITNNVSLPAADAQAIADGATVGLNLRVEDNGP